MSKRLKIAFCLTVFFAFCQSSFAQNDTLRALFIGNSYTGGNNLPQLVENVASGKGKTLIFDSHNPGGNILEQHAVNPTALSKIMTGNWDYVVLQEQSQIPTIDFYRYNSMYPATERLRDSILKYNPCAEIVMFMTWGRRFGGQQCDQTATHCSPDFVDFNHMQDSLESAYVGAANLIGARVAPVGISWKKVLNDTTLVLHTGDNSHPNFDGSYVAACTFFSVFWNEESYGSTYAGSLTNSLSLYYQQKADSAVFHSTNDWNATIYAVEANFSYAVSGNNVTFTDQSSGPGQLTYLWEYGDGATSTQNQETHTFNSPGTYEVCLTVTNGCKEHVFCDTIELVDPSASISELSLNPDVKLIGITDLQGRATSFRPNVVLFYHYSDGSVRRIYRVSED